MQRVFSARNGPGKRVQCDLSRPSEESLSEALRIGPIELLIRLF